MTFATGTCFGPYEITAVIGAGGMGEVYRALDTKLGREVAIKTLPSALAQDPERLARFEREAKLLATLNHAHIGAIYGLDEYAGTQFIAMELIEGQTLEEKLKDGALPVEDALRIALQIAEALEAAHEKGVIHRDLKPANVMLTRDGVVKVLDFGLAKAFSGDPNTVTPAHSPALSLAMTQAGLIIGTAGYMSPEQASGQATDQRADIWAFGVVLYEMLAGLPLFSGESVPHILADVLRTEPDWKRLPKNLHPRLKLLLERCLEKKVRNRCHSIADVRVDLEKVLSDPHGLTVPAVAAAQSPWRHTVRVGAIGVLGGILIAGLTAWVLRPAERVAPMESRLSVLVPPERGLRFGGSPHKAIAISPDGATIVFTSRNADAAAGAQQAQLALRSLATHAVRDLPGTAGARQPFFSPDGRWIGFFTAAGELKKVPIAGGSAVTLSQTVADAPWAFGVWTEDGAIIFGSVTGGLHRISAEGGETSELTAPDVGNDELNHSAPALVPSNQAVLFHVRDSALRARIEAVVLDSGERRVVVENGRYPVVLGDGRLLFQRDDTILIAPFDFEELRLTGTAVPLVDAVQFDSPDRVDSAAQLAVSRNGTLVYLPVADEDYSLVVVTRDGTPEPLGLPPGRYELPRVSPNGQEIAFIERQGQQRQLRTYDLARGTFLDLGQAEGFGGPAWRPDGRALAIAATTPNTVGIFLKDLDDGTTRQLADRPPGFALLKSISWSPDGTHLAYAAQTGSLLDIWELSLGEEVTNARLIQSETAKHSPAFSPAGPWIAYVSAASGPMQIYIQRYPQGERLPVALGSGPVWRSDGKELYYDGFDASGIQKRMAITVSADGKSLQLGSPEGLFELAGLDGPVGAGFRRSSNSGPEYDVFPDGERFLMIRGTDSQASNEIVVVQNWFEEVKQRVPTR